MTRHMRSLSAGPLPASHEEICTVHVSILARSSSGSMHSTTRGAILRPSAVVESQLGGRGRGVDIRAYPRYLSTRARRKLSRREGKAFGDVGKNKNQQESEGMPASGKQLGT